MQVTQRTWTAVLIALVVAGGVVGASLGLAVGGVVVPGYDASAYLLVTPSGENPVQTSEVQYAQAISQVVTNPTVLAAAGTSADLPSDARKVRADPSPNAPLIELTVNAPTADGARRQAQAAADAVVAYTLERVDVLGFQAVELAPAAAGEPAGLSPVAHLVAGAAMGAVLGGLAGLLRGQRPAAAPPASAPAAGSDARLVPATAATGSDAAAGSTAGSVADPDAAGTELATSTARRSTS